MYFDHVSPPPTSLKAIYLLTQICILSPPSLYLKKKKTQKLKSKQTNKQKNIKTKAMPSYPQKNKNSILCWKAPPGHSACPGVWLIYPVPLQGR